MRNLRRALNFLRACRPPLIWAVEAASPVIHGCCSSSAAVGRLRGSCGGQEWWAGILGEHGRGPYRVETRGLELRGPSEKPAREHAKATTKTTKSSLALSATLLPTTNNAFQKAPYLGQKLITQQLDARLRNALKISAEIRLLRVHGAEADLLIRLAKERERTCNNNKDALARDRLCRLGLTAQKQHEHWQ